MMKRIALFAITALLAMTALAQGGNSLWWGYYHETDVPDSYLGVSKATVYEAAIHVNGNAAPLQDATVNAVRLPFANTAHIDSLTLWITSNLEEGERMATVVVESPVEGWNVVTLPEPVNIPETGLYVGYTFKVTELDGQSEHPLVMCNDINEGGLWLRVASVKAYAEWFTTKRYGSLALQLELQGESLLQSSVAVDAIRSNNMVALSQDNLQVMLTNYGTAPVTMLQYTYTFGNESKTGSYVMPLPLTNVYGLQTTVTLPVTAPVATGRMDGVLSIDATNGGENVNEQRQASTSLINLQRKTRHRTVMEEYTGTWCSACPRGFAGIARLKSLYPNDFIALSVHALNGDPMDVYYDYYYVMNTTQFPGCRFDRGPVTDPYEGDYSDGHFHADLNFIDANSILAPADLSVEATWMSDSLCTISSKADFAFDDAECGYLLAYVMVEDSLCGPEGDHKWHQKNSFNDPSQAYYVEEDMQQYVNAEGMMLDNVKYNDVVISMSDVRGIDGSLMGPQIAGVPMTHQYELRRTAVSQNPYNIHVVCMLIDKQTKLIVNAAVCNVSGDPSAVREIDDSEIGGESIRYYDLLGRCLGSQARKGIVITRQKDGTIRKSVNK